MKDIDTISRELSKKMRGLNDHEDNDFTIIKSALTAVRNEALDEAAEVCRGPTKGMTNGMQLIGEGYAQNIEALKLPSEKVKP